ncbi:glycosyltransferase family 39 protein [Nocardia brasiliensis]|uniref:glycosyltransferase family 39 protein n=1 Tax=Nocardia brasiliensis TaxID=37326 RepID=UPI00245828DC|nr:glycosyltransferase family 39 protein [Nocardia brasiliensis]
MTAGRVRVPIVVFGAATALYLVTGIWLTAGRGFLMGDALSRVSATQAALFSRDPHLSAIGFVFTPLTSLAQLPMVAFEPLVPAITTWGLSGVLMSALFMGGAATMIHGIGADRAAPPWLTLCVTVLFTVNPMIVFYGGNGMSEAPFLFCLCWAVRRLMRWVHTDGAHDLTACGIALGLAYLTRYDAVAPAAAAALLVGVLSGRRRRGTEYRWSGVAMDLVVLLAPIALAFVVWAGTSWLITGQAFQQFTSQYGNTAILAQSGATSAAEKTAALHYSIASMLVLGPALPLLLPLACALAARRRDLAVTVPILLCGAVLAFQTMSYLSGSTFAFLRFYVAAIPLAAVLALCIAPARDRPPSHRPGPHALAPPPRRNAPVAALVVTVVLLGAGLPVTVAGMNNHDLAVQEYALGAAVFPQRDNASARYADKRRIAATFGTGRKVAEYLDALHLPRGSVLMDTVFGFSVVIASAHPDQFVVPSDRDFVRVLNRPAERGVRYILAVPATGRGVSDAVNRRYPTLYENGAEIATLTLEVPNDGAGEPDWRLYRVLGAS